MHIPKRYFHDRRILLILSVNVFLAVLIVVLILLKFDSSRASGYIIEYRPRKGFLSAYRSGSASTFISFILFSIFTVIFNTLLSMRAYPVRRYFAVAILAMSTVILVLTLIVSNALLELR